MEVIKGEEQNVDVSYPPEEFLCNRLRYDPVVCVGNRPEQNVNPDKTETQGVLEHDNILSLNQTLLNYHFASKLKIKTEGHQVQSCA